MIYVGIDIASDKHDYYIIHDSLVYFSKDSLTISNSDSGYKKLHKDIQTFCGAMNDDRVRIGLESTGFYHLNILKYLTELGYDVELINPMIINLFKKSRKVHHPKTDNLDSKAIAAYISQQTDFKPYTIKSYHISALKSLSRERFNLVEEMRKTKLAIYKLITIIFPEYHTLFSNIYGESSLSILSSYSSPKKLSRARAETISRLLHGKCTIDAYSIILKAKQSIGNSSPQLEFCLLEKISTLKEQLKRINRYDTIIKEYVDLIDSYITTIPGISYITAGLILGEIGDITKFKNVDQLISYSGIDIEVYESGKFKSEYNHMSKRGSKYLRYALYQVSKTIWRFDPAFSEYYLKKQLEGKHFYVILGHIEKKVLRVIYSVLKNNKPYTPQV